MIDKEKIHRHCEDHLENKAKRLRQAIADTRSSNTDTKSSMGDKYETSREMLQQEIMMLEKQLSETKVQLEQLRKIGITANHDIRTGALVKTDAIYLYILVGLGQIELDGVTIMTVSSSAPIAKQLIGKSKGDVYLLNRKESKILEVS